MKQYVALHWPQHPLPRKGSNTQENGPEKIQLKILKAFLGVGEG